MKLRWFLSGTVRQAADMLKHVRKLLNAQRDILSPQAVAAVEAAINKLQAAINSDASNDSLQVEMTELEAVATKWIKPYPHTEWRENIEVFLVAIVVAMAIRTFFLQPFKIPTGSMEPTLFGIETEDLRDQPDFKIPNALERFWDVIYYGEIFHQVIAPADGVVVNEGPLQHVFHFINKQTIFVQYAGQNDLTPINIYFGPDGRLDFSTRQMTGLEAGLIRGEFKKGEPIVCFKETTGDHLFVDRLSYNFRHPHRGDIVVFKTKGIDGIHDQDQFYIKRLIGLSGETVSIGDDQHVRINGVRLDASTPNFDNVYGFNPKLPAREGKTGQYNGHTLQNRPDALLRSPTDSIAVRPDHVLVMGDNTMNSFDSRYWGDFPEPNIIGKAFFVYWPISPRFGIGQH